MTTTASETTPARAPGTVPALVGRGYMATFEACKRDGVSTFPGPPCYQPHTDPPLYLGIGYNCTRTGQQCSAKTCPECTANAPREVRETR